MCTVSFIARQRGYRLGMNRDEKLARPAGLPPKLRVRNGRAVLSPSEPGGGTWIALNDSGATLALINWYACKARVLENPVSRGEVVNTLSTASSAAEANAAFKNLPLKRINPFRLVGIFLATREVTEWRWNLKRLKRLNHGWRSQQWISSGFDEPAAQRIRSRTFRQRKPQATFGSPAWLRRLHRSHAPQRGPFSTCMHRADAATVSYTEISVSPARAVMRHHEGAPCDACSGLGSVALPVIETTVRENRSRPHSKHRRRPSRSDDALRLNVWRESTA